MSAITPPIVLDDGNMFESVERLRSYFCFPTDVSDVREAFDARGHRVSLVADSDEAPIQVMVDPEERLDELHTMLRRIVGERSVRFGLDHSAGVEGLLRALWRRHHRQPYPRDLPQP